MNLRLDAGQELVSAAPPVGVAEPLGPRDELEDVVLRETGILRRRLHGHRHLQAGFAVGHVQHDLIRIWCVPDYFTPYVVVLSNIFSWLAHTFPVRQ